MKIFKKHLSLFLVFAMILSFMPMAANVAMAAETTNDGVFVYKTSEGDSWSGANIILGNDANVWPWSTAADDGKVAFTPEGDATYRLTLNVTSHESSGATGIRIRWISGNANGGYLDDSVVNDNPYSASQTATQMPVYFNSGISAGNEYTLVSEIKMDAGIAKGGLIGNIAVRGGGGSNDFDINTIKMEQLDAEGNVVKTVVNWPEGIPVEPVKPVGVHVLKTSEGASWSGANIIVNNNANVWPWSTTDAGEVAFKPEKDAVYRMTFNVTSHASGGATGIRVRWISGNGNGGYLDSGSENNNPYSASQTATQMPAYFNSGISAGNEYTLVAEIKMDSGVAKGGMIGNIAIRGGAGSNDFDINWILIEKLDDDGNAVKRVVNWPEGLLPSEVEDTGEALPEAGMTYEHYTPIKEVYKDYFLAGQFGNTNYPAAFGYHLSKYAPGNVMKPNNTQNVKGQFTYTNAENEFNKYAATMPEGETMIRYGHVLAWHDQSPAWMWDGAAAAGQSGVFDRDVAIANLTNHIDNVLGHFGASLAGMDVVNEAITGSTAFPSGTPTTEQIEAWWRNGLRAGTWNQAIGTDWIEIAFKAAADVVDKNGWDCKLIYNDFGLDSQIKARYVYEMVKSINERNADYRKNGKPLIEVIGMQGHYDSNTNTQNVENSIKLFATLPGVTVHVTELDIGCAAGTLTDTKQINQAMVYAELFSIYKKYAVGPANTTDNPRVIERVSFCDLYDHEAGGWRGGMFASLFTTDGYAKQSLLAVLNPELYLETHDRIVDEGTGVVIDGVDVFSKSNGDEYTYANVYLGNDSEVWPWSEPGVDEKVAFTAEKGATYRFTYNVIVTGGSEVSVRWVNGGGVNDFTQADIAAYQENTTKLSPGTKAVSLPARFDANAMIGGQAYNLVAEVTLDGDASAEGLIGSVGLRGDGDFAVNTIKVEKIVDGQAEKTLVNWPEGVSNKVSGISVQVGSVTQADILIGNDSSVWPWSVNDGHGRAFIPEKDAKYRFIFNVTSLGTTAFRVRWHTSSSWGSVTDTDNASQGTAPFNANINPTTGGVATTIPAYFNGGMTNGGSYTLVTEIVLDGNEPAQGLIGNVGLRGGGGSHAFDVNWIRVEKIEETGDTVLVEWASGVKFTIKATAGTGGAISSKGAISVGKGKSQTYTITPNSGYTIKSVLVDGVDVGAVETYTFTQVDDDHTIEAIFEGSAASTYTITASAGLGGTISPDGVTVLDEGASQTYTITPDNGYAIEAVLVDGTDVGAVGSYTFAQVESDHTIEAIFATSATDTHTIIASAGLGGSISPDGATAVAEGASQTYTITPDENYRIAGVLIDGVNKGALSSYTFENVSKSHTIEVTFIENTIDNMISPIASIEEEQTTFAFGSAPVIPVGTFVFINNDPNRPVNAYISADGSGLILDIDYSELEPGTIIAISGISFNDPLLSGLIFNYAIGVK